MPNRIPKSAAKAKSSKKEVVATYDGSYNSFFPAWRIGKFDYASKWGLKALLGEFTFQYKDVSLEKLIDKNDEKLNGVLEALDGNEFTSVDEFWHKLVTLYGGDVPSDMLEHISLGLVRDGFQKKIYPKLKSYESNTWTEILSYTHRRKNQMVSNNHVVQVENLTKEARSRLEELKYNVDEIFSLRLEALFRIYGFRVQNYLEILWVDREHKIYELDYD